MKPAVDTVSAMEVMGMEMLAQVLAEVYPLLIDDDREDDRAALDESLAARCTCL